MPNKIPQARNGTMPFRSSYLGDQHEHCFGGREIYTDTEQFIQGQHTVPERIESGMAGLHVGEIKTFSLSAEEGYGPRDETNLQLIPTIDLPPGTREGDALADEAGRYAKVILMLPEITLIDLNHPLAGQPLVLTLQVVTIQHPDERNNTETEDDPLSRRTIGWFSEGHHARLVSLEWKNVHFDTAMDVSGEIEAHYRRTGASQ